MIGQMSKERAAITIVTAGHLSNCPRMLKAADALHGEGYRVRVVSVSHTPWSAEADRALRATRDWEWTIVDYARDTARATQFMTGARFHAARRVAGWLGPSRLPMAIAARACGRAHSELVRAAVAAPADFIYGGSTRRAPRSRRRPCADREQPDGQRGVHQ